MKNVHLTSSKMVYGLFAFLFLFPAGCSVKTASFALTSSATSSVMVINPYQERFAVKDDGSAAGEVEKVTLNSKAVNGSLFTTEKVLVSEADLSSLVTAYDDLINAQFTAEDSLSVLSTEPYYVFFLSDGHEDFCLEIQYDTAMTSAKLSLSEVTVYSGIPDLRRKITDLTQAKVITGYFDSQKAD
jgi:hypothetical protein